MNREEIENMKAGKDLDVLVVENIMGGFSEHPEAWTAKEEFSFQIHHDEVLIGEPWTDPAMGGMYAHQWRKFNPSENLMDAWLVVMTMEDKWFWFTLSNVVPDSGDSIVYEAGFCKRDDYGTCEYTAPLAITKAALLAIIGHEEK